MATRSPARPSTRSAIVRNATANFALPAAAVLTGPLLARALGVEDRGAVAAVLAGLTLVSFLAPLGMQEALVYSVGRGLVPVRRAARVSLETSLLFGSAAAVVLALLAPLLLRDAPHFVWLLRAVALTVPFAVLISCLRGIAQAQHRFELTARERWLLGLGRVALIVPLFLAGALTVESAVWASALLPLAAMLALLPGLRTRAGEPLSTDVPLPASRRLVLGYSSRTAPGTMLSVLSTRIDQILLAPIAGVSALGLYAVAVSLAEIPLQGTNAVRDVIFATSSSRDEPLLVARAVRVVTLIALPVSLVAAGLTPFVLPLLFGADFEEAVPLAQILLLSLTPQVTGSLFIVGLLGIGRPGLRSWVQLATNAVQLVLLLVLIHTHGELGAALAVLIARLVTTVTFAVTFARGAGIPVHTCFVPRRSDLRDVAGAAKVLRRGRSAAAGTP